MNDLQKKKLMEVLSQLSGVENVHEGDYLLTDLGLDSLALVNLMVMLEEAFGIEFSPSDPDPFALSAVEDVMLLVAKYIDGGEGNV